jgi:hypothetical protein
MTSGLKWWHEICREVRKAGAAFGNSRRSLLSKGDPIRMNINNISYRSTGDPLRPLTPRAQEFLRAQWMSAYKKARYGI